MGRKLSVKIEGKKKHILFNEQIYVRPCEYIKVDSIIVIWDYENAPIGIGLIIEPVGGDPIGESIGPGYMTFGDIKKFFSENNMDLVSTPVNGKCYLQNNNSVQAAINGEHRELLGIGTDIIPANRKVVGTNLVDINRGLKFVKVKCTAVDGRRCLEEKSGRTYRSESIATIPLPSSPLSHVVQFVNDLGSGTPIRSDTFCEMEFSLTDQDDKAIEIGTVILNMTIG